MAQDYLTLYGLKCSYFTGKLEGYLRYKEIPFQYKAMSNGFFSKELPKKVGTAQMPAAQLADGRWLTDTTPMIDWLEGQFSQHSITPQDPTLQFLARLIEDYADEWLWRPAMYYRWSFAQDRILLSRKITDEMFTDMFAPGALKRALITHRQRQTFVKDDAVNASTRAHVEQSYIKILSLLETIFQQRPFVLGAQPSLADFGLFGPMFRHFSQDPTPAAIMMEQAPAVFEWTYRLWNAKSSRISGDWVNTLPDDLLPLLTEIGATHLENLCSNAQAWSSQQKSYDSNIQGTHYRKQPTSQYRVWCLEELQRHFHRLNASSGDRLKSILEQQQCLEPLLRIENPQSNYSADDLPFGQSIKVYPV